MDTRHAAEISRRLIGNRFLLKLLTAFHVFLYRKTQGYLGSSVSNLPVLLLTTRGRKSGRRRTVPLCYLPVAPQAELPGAGGRSMFAVIGACGGSPTSPSWYLNLQSNSVAEIEVKSQRMSVTSRVVDGEFAQNLWREFCECYPGYEVFQNATNRRFPIVVLENY